MSNEELEAAVMDVLGSMLGYHKNPDGTFSYEIYADYQDVMDGKTAIGILQADDPVQQLWETLDEWYLDYKCQLRDELEEAVLEKLLSGRGIVLADEEMDFVQGLLLEKVFFELPEKHYLSQTFHVDIMVDTGDGDYGYTLNGSYPCWDGDTCINRKAGIAWLAKSQGYTGARLRNALRKGDMRDPKGFLESMRVEVANLLSGACTVTFLVEMTLEELIELNRLIRLQDRNGYFPDAGRKPYCGYVILDKATETGLFDPWDGCGGCFSIELERDVKLPVKYIRSALPDGGDGHAVESVFGMCGSAWLRGGVKRIHAPVKLPA